MELVFGVDTKHRKEWFTGISFSHPAKMSLPLQLWIIENYTKPGDTILDPMAGSGTVLVACSLGRNVIAVELEPKFVEIMKGNWEKIKQRGPQLGYSMGQAQIIQGDARNLEDILVDHAVFSPPFQAQKVGGKQGAGSYSGTDLSQGLNRVKDDYLAAEHPNNIGNLPYGDIDSIVTSPPYAETGVGDWKTGRAEFQAWVINELGTKRYVEWQGKRYTESEWRAMNHGRIDGRTTKGVHKHPTDGYGNTNGQIGNLPYGDIDSIITSPPYEGIEARDRSKEQSFERERSGKYPRRGDLNISKGYSVDSVITSPPYEGAMDGSSRHTKGGIPQPDLKMKRLGSYDTTNPANIGNLYKESYLSAMLQVYQQCYRALRLGGFMVLVTKNFIREKKEVHLDDDTIRLCEAAGFSFVERHYRKLPAQSFWRTIYMQKYPDAPVIDKEDILVFRRR